MNDQLNYLLQIGIVGTSISVLVQMIKNKWGADSNATKIIVISLSVVSATIFWFLQDTQLWVNIVSILGFATTVYALFIKQ